MATKPSKPNRKRGREADYAIGRDGQRIIGLSRNAYDGRYYATHSRPRKWFGSDLDLAIQRFQAWEAEREGAEVVFDSPDEFNRNFADALQHTERGRRLALKFKSIVREADYWAMVARDLRLRPDIVAQRTGIPEVARLASLPPLEPSPSLKSLGDLYYEKSRGSTRWNSRTRIYWNDFASVIKVKTLREVKQDHIAAFHDEIFSRGHSPTYVGHHFGAVKTVLAHAAKRGIAPTEVARVLSLCRMLVPPKKKSTDPHPISREAFHALLAVSDSKWTAALMLALNCCMYGAEVSDIRKADIDLDKGTLVTSRNKTGVVRIAVLWSETIEAIRQYQTECPHESEYLLVSRTGAAYDGNHMGRNFARRRTEAGLTDVEFNHLRDGAYSAAIDGGADLLHAKLLAGHATGISDHYVKRNPRMVADACEAVYRAYFPPPPPNEG